MGRTLPKNDHLVTIYSKVIKADVEQISLDIADCTHFKRKQLQNSACLLNFSQWKSAFKELCMGKSENVM